MSAAVAKGEALSLLLVLTLFCPCGAQASDNGANSTGGNLSREWHNRLSDQIVDYTVEHPSPVPFTPNCDSDLASKELLSIALQQGMRKPGERIDSLLDDSLETFPRHWLTEYYLHHFPMLTNRVEAINSIFDLEKQTLALVEAQLTDQLCHLTPFRWPTAADKFNAQALVRATGRQLNMWNMQARANASVGSNGWYSGSGGGFRMGTAYRQLLDISQNGWARSLNWDPSSGALSTPDAVNALSPDASAPPIQQPADNYSDIDSSLAATSQASDQAMLQYNQDASSQGITTGLQGTAQQNVFVVRHMTYWQNQVIRGDIAILVKGVMAGAAISAGAVALRYLPHMVVASPHTFLATPAHASAIPAAPSHMFTPQIGGSWDGAAGQTLLGF